MLLDFNHVDVAKFALVVGHLVSFALVLEHLLSATKCKFALVLEHVFVENLHFYGALGTLACPGQPRAASGSPGQLAASKFVKITKS